MPRRTNKVSSSDLSESRQAQREALAITMRSYLLLLDEFQRMPFENEAALRSLHTRLLSLEDVLQVQLNRLQRRG